MPAKSVDDAGSGRSESGSRRLDGGPRDAVMDADRAKDVGQDVRSGSDVQVLDTAVGPDASAGDSTGARDSGPSRRPTAAEWTTAKARIEAFVESRDQPTPIPAADVARELSEQGFSADEVESLIRSGPTSYPPVPAVGEMNCPLDTIVQMSADCYHATYSSAYMQYVPIDYDHTVARPLVVLGHGGNSAMSRMYAEESAIGAILAYKSFSLGGPSTDASSTSTTLGAILIAPATTVGWNSVGDSLIETAISQTIRAFHIDPDRIYIAGHSMGGHLTWRSAMNHGDRYAAFAPQSGGYASYIENHLIENTFNTHGYVTYGSEEPYELDVTNDLLGAWLHEHAYPWTVVKKSGGHSIYQDEVAKMVPFFAALRRDMYPKRTFLHAVGELKLVDTKGSDIVSRPGRPLRWNFRHWIEIEARPDLPNGATFLGENKGGNRLEIVSDGVRHLTVLLHPKMVDLTSEVTIVVNGEVKYQAIPTVDFAQMLERVREFDDRGRVFQAAVPIDVTTDQAVPMPDYH